MDGDRNEPGEAPLSQSEPAPAMPASPPNPEPEGPPAAGPWQPPTPPPAAWQPAGTQPQAWRPPAPWGPAAGGPPLPDAAPLQWDTGGLPPGAYPPPAAAYPPPGSYPTPGAYPAPAAAYPPPYPPPSWSQSVHSMTPTFVTARRLASIVTVMLAIAGVAALVESIHFLLGVDLQGRINAAQATQADADSFNGVMVALSWTRVGIAVITGIVFMRWLWRSLNNSFHLDCAYGISSPRMSVVAWFIPLYNLIRPYQIVMDLHDRLLSPLSSKSGRWLIRVWWIFWILGTFFGEAVLFTSRSSGSSPTGIDRLGTMALLGACSALTVADAVLAIAVVRQVQRLSDARELARRGYPMPAIDLVTSSQQSRVTRVPFALAAAAIVVLIVPLGLVYGGASAPPTWVQFQPADKKFTVSMPRTPLEKPIAPYEANGLTISGDIFQAGERGTLAFVVTYYDYPAGVLSSMPSNSVLDNLQSTMGKSVTIQSSSDRSVNGQPAREVKASGSGLQFHVIYCLDGDRVYVVEADYTAAEAASADIDRFLNSFTLP